MAKANSTEAVKKVIGVTVKSRATNSGLMQTSENSDPADLVYAASAIIELIRKQTSNLVDCEFDISSELMGISNQLEIAEAMLDALSFKEVEVAA